MRAWEKRSAEEANLLNPPFIGGLCLEVIREYCDRSKNDAPYPLPFLSIPLILHKKTRESLPSSVRTPFVTWVLSPTGTQVKTRYAIHVKVLVPVVKEALLFIINRGFLSITQEGYFQIGTNNLRLTKAPADFTDEVNDCFSRSGFCGRWFARSGKIETVMAMLGVKP